MLLSILMLLDTCLVWVFDFYPADVVLWSLCVSYILFSFELLVLAILQRRQVIEKQYYFLKFIHTQRGTRSLGESSYSSIRTIGRINIKMCMFNLIFYLHVCMSTIIKEFKQNPYELISESPLALNIGDCVVYFLISLPPDCRCGGSDIFTLYNIPRNTKFPINCYYADHSL